MHRQSIISQKSGKCLNRVGAAKPQHGAKRLCLSGTIFKMIRPGYASALTALCLALLIALTANAQRRSSGTATATSIPSPSDVFGFNPGDDRTIVDWKQITDYF